MRSKFIFRILVVIGTRPEAIKMAPLIKRLAENAKFEVKVCVTGQHREMLDQVLTVFDIVPDFDLAVMKPGQSLTEITTAILSGMQNLLTTLLPDCLLVHGDTTTTFVAGLAAFYQQIPVAHVEAGLRSQDLYSPWPEEGNRKLMGSLAQLHFAPTERAKENLLREGINENRIFVTGNTVIDALFSGVSQLTESNTLTAQLMQQFFFLSETRKMILITGHRRENFGQGFENICKALSHLARENPNVDFVYPVHLNPKVQKPVHTHLSNFANIHLIPPQNYLPFLYLMQRSYIILTDSGGIQEEAPSLGKPVLVMRETTERPEAIAAGGVRLVGVDDAKIIQTIQELLEDSKAYAKMVKIHNPYGDGHACEKIEKYLQGMLSHWAGEQQLKEVVDAI